MAASLELEFIKPAIHPMLRLRWVGLLVLMIGVALFTFTWKSYFNLRAEHISIQEKLASLKTTEQSVNMTSASETIGINQLNGIKSSVYEIFIPWDDLFNSFEDASIKNVVLLSLQPNSKKKQIIISGEADSYQTIINYIDRLSEQSAFSEVHLKKHAVKENDDNKPVRFTIFARWSSKSSELLL
jgi:Tfp pilus assembly protein PilN